MGKKVGKKVGKKGRKKKTKKNTRPVIFQHSPHSFTNHYRALYRAAKTFGARNETR